MTTNRTFTMLKPDAVANGYIGAILNQITNDGFKIIAMKYLEWGNFDQYKKIILEYEKTPTSIRPFNAHIIYTRQRSDLHLMELNFKKALSQYLFLDSNKIRMSDVNITINYLDIAKTYLLMNKSDSAKIFLDKA